MGVASPQVRRSPPWWSWAIAAGVLVIGIAMWANGTRGGGGDDAQPIDLDGPVLVRPDIPTKPAVEGFAVPTGPFDLLGGGSATLASLADGRPMVVNLWASTCAPCVQEMPALQQVHEEVGDSVAFVGLAVEDRPSAARDLATRTGVTYPLGLDPSGQVLADLGGIALPTSVFVGADGRIVQTHTGAMSADDVRDGIAQLRG